MLSNKPYTVSESSFVYGKSNGVDVTIDNSSASSTHRVQFDPESESATDAVMAILSEVTENAVEDIEHIGNVVDPIVFDALVRRHRQPIQVSFELYGFDVAVESTGVITVRPVQADGGLEYSTQFDEHTSPTDAIIRAIANVREVESRELESLNDMPKRGALEKLFDHMPSEELPSLHVSFQIDDWQVTVSGDRCVVVRALDYCP